MPPPENRKELETFLGLITYVSKFLPNVSEITAPLRELVKEAVHWHWEHAQIEAFEKLKEMLSNAPVLTFFNSNKPVKLSVDASKYALGAVLLQEGKPVAYASRALTKTEGNYAQIEKEMLAIVFGVERFHQYVYGREVEVETDHKPLEIILKKPIHCAPPRIQRFMLRMQRYQINVKYTPGKELLIADALSRAVAKNEEVENQNSSDENILVHYLTEEEIEAQVHLLTSNLPISEAKRKEFQEATNADQQLEMLKLEILKGWPENKKKVQDIIKPFWIYREEMHVTDNLIFKGERIVVPKSLRKEMLSLIHASHQGIQSCKSRARECLFWPNMGRDIEEKVQSCAMCNENRRMQQSEPLIPHEVPERPWEKIGIDLFQLQGKKYLIAVDYYSKFPEIALLGKTDSKSVIIHLKSIFARHGIPDVVMSDNGPQFSSSDFSKFSKEWNFKHATSSPKFAQSNGMAERTIQTIKNALKKQSDPYLALLDIRNTASLDIKASPAQMLMGRRLKSLLPTTNKLLKPETINKKVLKENLIKRQQKQKGYHDSNTQSLPLLKVGEYVRMESKGKWIPAQVVKKHSTRSYIVQTSDGAKYRRNRKQLLHTKESFQNSAQIDSESEDELPMQMDSQERVIPPEGAKMTRSGRIVRPPIRYPD